MDYVEFLEKYGHDNDKITRNDLRDFAALGGSQADAQKFLEKAAAGKKGYEGKVGEGAYEFAEKAEKFPGTLTSDYFDAAVGGGNYFSDVLGPLETTNILGGGPIPETIAAPSSSSSKDTNDPQDFVDEYVGTSVIDWDRYGAIISGQQTHETNLTNLNNLTNTHIQNLENAGGIAIAGIQATADIYGYDTSYDIAQLDDARERDLVQYTTQVEDTRLRDFKDKDIAYGLNLQNIINSGLVAVAETQGMYSVSGIEIRGGYDKEIEQIRAAANTDIAQMNMYANMMMAMGF